MEERFTTAEVAKICGVNVTTIRRWIDTSNLKAIKTPGKHSRILKSDLIDFLKLYNFPVPLFLKGAMNFVIISNNQKVLDSLKTEFQNQYPGHNVHVCYSGYESLILLGRINPDIVVIDSILADINIVEMCKTIERSFKDRPVKIITFFQSPSLQIQEELKAANFRFFLFWPITPEAFRTVTMIS